MGILNNDDYRFSVDMCLQILREEREKLYNDSKRIESDILNGLWSFSDDEKTLQNLYFEKYTVNWLYGHWEKLNNIIDRHTEYTKMEKRDFVFLFAKYFKNFFNKLCNFDTNSTFSIDEIISIDRIAVTKLIEVNDKWEENVSAFKALKVIHKKKFAAALEKAKNSKD